MHIVLAQDSYQHSLLWPYNLLCRVTDSFKLSVILLLVVSKSNVYWQSSRPRWVWSAIYQRTLVVLEPPLGLKVNSNRNFYNDYVKHIQAVNEYWFWTKCLFDTMFLCNEWNMNIKERKTNLKNHNRFLKREIRHVFFSDS